MSKGGLLILDIQQERGPLPDLKKSENRPRPRIGLVLRLLTNVNIFAVNVRCMT